MGANALPKQEKQITGETRRAERVSAQALQKCYETATFPLIERFPVIDAWLAEHVPDLWQQIRQEDDELFRLRQLNAPVTKYQAKLDAFVELCERAERLYHEAQPTVPRLPPLAEGARAAVYHELGDGTLVKVNGEEE